MLTIAMILFPIMADMLGFEGDLAGVFLGATIHDVAQVVGAVFSISDQPGEIATVVKLIRVAMLVLLASIVICNIGAATHTQSVGARLPIMPGFGLAFVVLVALNSFNLFPGPSPMAPQLCSDGRC
jgi:uncharacterized membrane protein YadS